MLSYTRFLKTSLLSLVLLTSLAFGADPATRLRIAAANITSGNHQTYDPGHGIRILQAVQPDIVALQEMNYGDNSPAAMEEFVEKTFGKGFHFYRETNPKYKIPNGIVSRYPILEAGSWPGPSVPDRGFAYAAVKLPGKQVLWVVSVHLHTKSAESRRAEAQVLLANLQKKVKTGDFITIAGDMNIKGDKEFALDVLSVLVDEKHKPDDGLGNRKTNAPRSKLYDRILVSPSLNAFHVPVEIDLKTNDPNPLKNKSVFPEGLVFDTRVVKPLPPPALENDSGSANMQHMLIVQDYLIPGAPASALSPENASHDETPPPPPMPE